MAISVTIDPRQVAPGQLFTVNVSNLTPDGQYSFYFNAPPPIPIAQSANALVFTADNNGDLVFSASILTTAAPGSYQLHIFDFTQGMDIDVETITVIPSPVGSAQALFKLNGAITASPSANVAPNTPFKIIVPIKNAGTQTGAGRIDIIAGGQVVATLNFGSIAANGTNSYPLSVNAGISNTTTYSVSILTQETISGTYNQTDSSSITITVLNQPPVPGGNGGSGSGTTSPFNATTLAIIAAGGVGLLVIGSLLMKKGKGIGKKLF